MCAYPVQTSSLQLAFVDKPMTFVIGDKEFSIALRYLVSHDYFYKMLNQKMKETQTGRVVLEDYWKDIFPAFLEFLKTGLLSVTDFSHTYRLFQLAHMYQIQALLKATSSQLLKEIPSHCAELLFLTHIYEHEEIKNACLKSLPNNQDLFHRLIELQAFGVIEMLLEGNSQSLPTLMTWRKGNDKMIFSKLLDEEQYSLAAKFLLVARKFNIRDIGLNHLEVIYQLLTECPSLEKIQLITTLAAGRSSILYIYNDSKDPPLHLVLRQGWQEAFTLLLACCTEENSIRRNLHQRQLCLLSLAMGKKDFKAMEDLKKHSEKFPFSEAELQEYVLIGIKISLAIVKMILSFPVDPLVRFPKRVNEKGIELAVESPEMLKLLWPHNNLEKHRKAEFCKKIFESNRLDLAPIFFDFDASKEHFPYSFPWIHHLAVHGSLEWLKFIIPLCTSLNESTQVKNGRNRTPLNLALQSKRPPEFIQCLLDGGADCSISDKDYDGSFNPLHQVLLCKDGDLLKLFLAKKPNLAAEDNVRRNFFHLLFSFGSKLLSDHLLSQIIKEVDTACLEAKDHEGNTPLHYAVKAQQHAGIFNILSVKSSLLWSVNNASKSPLQMVTGQQFEETINQLVSSCIIAPALKKDLLLWCAQHYLYHYCEPLIRGGADIRVIQKDGKNLLHLAVEAGAHLAVQQLISLGIPVDSQDHQRRTALHYGVIRRCQSGRSSH